MTLALKVSAIWNNSTLSSEEQLKNLDVKNLFHADEHIGEINNFDDFYHSVQLFLDLFERFHRRLQFRWSFGKRRILCSTNGEAVQVIAFAGEKSGNLGQNTYLVFYVEGNPSFFHAFICHWINLLLINNP